jgi:mannosyltransferase
MAPLEGMACGVPFVGSDTGYYRAFSAQGRCGQVVPLEDVAGAVAHADRLLSDPELFARQSRDARDLAQYSFSARNEADGIGRVYDRLWS